MRELLQDLGSTLADRPVVQVVSNLGRVAALLSLDTPAVRTLATALFFGSPRDIAIHNAYTQGRAVWTVLNADAEHSSRLRSQPSVTQTVARQTSSANGQDP